MWKVCYLQQHRVDAGDAWLWNGRQEEVFYSEGRNINTFTLPENIMTLAFMSKKDFPVGVS